MRAWRRIASCCAALCTLLVLLTLARGARADSFVHIRIQGVINPVKARYAEQAVARAQQEGASFLLVSIDTPGGLVSSMDRITRAFISAEIPVIGFVEPETAQATSAGAFILLATDLAAMAPHTRVGAAHPVGGEGKDLEGAMNDKATNSLVALARSLAKRSGRPEDFAEAIVRDSKSFTAEEAKDIGAVELLAANTNDLLRKIDGRNVKHGNKNFKLRTSGAQAIEVPPSPIEWLLDYVADPTIASMLLSLGMLGILYELSSPGIGAAGMVGIVSLLVGLLGMSVLPLALGGALLLLVGFIAIGLEVKVQTHGLLAAGGVVAVLLGALFLVDEGSYFGGAQLVDWRVFGPFLLVIVTSFVLLLGLVLRSQRTPLQSGVSTLLGKRGRATLTFEPVGALYEGEVFVDGARWRAESDVAIVEKHDVEVVGVLSQPTGLKVKPAPISG